MAAQDLPDHSARIAARVPQDDRKALEAIAYEASEPGDVVAISEVVREAVQAYLDDADVPTEELSDDAYQTAAQRREEATE